MTRPLARAAILALSVILSSCAPSAGSAAFWGGFWQGYDGGSSYAPISTHSAYGAVESVITSDFSGFSTGEVFVLANGQVWQQIEYYTWYWHTFRPRVTVYSDYGGYKMMVDGISHPVSVRRLR
ncbi:MAG TPA: hypothetical protein VF164_04600 [Trueperaceae bacterium]